MPVPPPNDTMVGTWANNEGAMKINAGYGWRRYECGWGRLEAPRKEGGGHWGDCVRLRIRDDGYTSYVSLLEQGRFTVIDMPVLSWADGAMHMPCGARLNYSLAADGRTLVVEGVTLRRFL